MNLKDRIRLHPIPKHVAIIMDGNGRWAKKQGKLRIFGHENGTKAVRTTVETCIKLGIQHLTLYAFSTENWNRPKLEIKTLMQLLISSLKNEINTLKKKDIILKKCGKGKPFTGNKYTMHGQIYEDVAIGIYESRHNYIKVYEFGLIAHPTVSCLGASPDGITPEGTMIEIKCPPKRVITGIVPHEYTCQMQIQLEVCNLQVCHFFECLIIEYKNKEEYLEDVYDKNNVNDLNIILVFSHENLITFLVPLIPTFLIFLSLSISLSSIVVPTFVIPAR